MVAPSQHRKHISTMSTWFVEMNALFWIQTHGKAECVGVGRWGWCILLSSFSGTWLEDRTLPQLNVGQPNKMVASLLGIIIIFLTMNIFRFLPGLLWCKVCLGCTGEQGEKSFVKLDSSFTIPHVWLFGTGGPFNMAKSRNFRSLGQNYLSCSRLKYPDLIQY